MRSANIPVELGAVVGTLAALSLMTGCWGGAAAIVVLAQRDGGGTARSPATVADLQVEGKTSPAALHFALVDAESDLADVEVLYRLDSGAPHPASIEGALVGLQSSPGGTDHAVLWHFGTQLGDQFREDVELLVRVRGTEGRFRSLQQGIGNDLPVLAKEQVRT